MKVLFVSSEAVPFAKTGGLADVAGALPVELFKLGCDVRLVMPLYRCVYDACDHLSLVTDNLLIALDTHYCWAQIWEGRLAESVPVYFVKCDQFFDRDGLYGTSTADYADNAQRYIFFCKAVIELCCRIDYAPEVISCHDWQTGMLPAYLDYACRDSKLFRKTASVYTIHNIAYQGIFDTERFALTGLTESHRSVTGFEYWGKINLMKAGIVYADMITTVSEQYSRDIQSGQYGWGLDGVIRERRNDVCGILNGVDYELWNPEQDPHIHTRYTPRTLGGKRKCKQDLLNYFGMFPHLIDRPLFGMITRLVQQKGLDLVADIFDELMARDTGFVLLGSGDQEYQDLFIEKTQRYQGKAGIVIAYDNVLAHKIEAGCDMYLMPSRYEPCGLNQIYSLKYGTVPIVRATGGLDDSIDDCGTDAEHGTGFKFSDYTPEALLSAIDRACAVFSNQPLWRQLQKRGMLRDFSWKVSAAAYIDVFLRAIQKRPWA
jgi:starch synthase